MSVTLQESKVIKAQKYDTKDPPYKSEVDDYVHETSRNDKKRIFGKNASSKNSDQPAHSRCLIRIFAEHILDSKGCEKFSCGQWRLRSDCSDAQANLSLHCAHILEGMFSHVAAQMVGNVGVQNSNHAVVHHENKPI